MSLIELISPPSGSPYHAAEVLAACQGPAVHAGPGEGFVGRPVTALIASDDDVIKLRTEYQLVEKQARRFVEMAIEREARLGVHHPHKTWFLWQPAEEPGRVVIGNITPRLLALDQSELLAGRFSPEAMVDLIAQAVECYLALFAAQEQSLDLGLSNFGLDADGSLYYLDDDVYAANDITPLSDAFGVWVRGLPWLTPALAQRLGRRAAQDMRRHFSDAHWVTVVAEGLRGVFIPPQRAALSAALIDGLYGRETTPTVEINERNATAPIERAASGLLALLADVHGNAPALEKALEYLAGRGIERGLMLGDVVGYGPHPRQCVAMLRGLEGWGMLRGNHDHAVANGQLRSGASALAQWSLDWTIAQLDEDEAAWLAELPVYLQADGWLAVHGSPRDKTFFNGYVYQMTYTENLDELARRGLPLCFHGHTHIQKTWLRDAEGDRGDASAEQTLSGVDHALICPGSVGQPRGGEPGVELAIVDLTEHRLEFVRLPYDLTLTVADMQRQGFPPEMGERLLKGQ